MDLGAYGFVGSSLLGVERCRGNGFELYGFMGLGFRGLWV